MSVHRHRHKTRPQGEDGKRWGAHLCHCSLPSPTEWERGGHHGGGQHFALRDLQRCGTVALSRAGVTAPRLPVSPTLTRLRCLADSGLSGLVLSRQLCLTLAWRLYPHWYPRYPNLPGLDQKPRTPIARCQLTKSPLACISQTLECGPRPQLWTCSTNPPCSIDACPQSSQYQRPNSDGNRTSLLGHFLLAREVRLLRPS